MESDKEQRGEFEAWERTQPRCIGYPKCVGGDLVGVEHEKDCPLYGVARSTGRRWMFGHLEVWQAAQSPLLERIRELETDAARVRDAVNVELAKLRADWNAALRRVAELEQGMREMLEAADAMARSNSTLNPFNKDYVRPWDKYYEAVEKLKALAPIPPSTEPK